MDEPTSGLNNVDIERFSKILVSLQAKKDTIMLIEHNIEFIAGIADYIIDFGVFGGEAGGKIIAQGSPEIVFAQKESSLYKLDKIPVGIHD